MQLAAINWHIYVITHSALALGLVGACRALPIILCSLMGGVVADVVDRRRLMMVTQTSMLLCSGALALVTFSGLTHAWPIFLLTAIASAAWAFDTPARQALMPTLVPAKDFPNAVSLSMLMFHIGLNQRATSGRISFGESRTGFGLRDKRGFVCGGHRGSRPNACKRQAREN
jgi:MFS family permease